MLLYLGAESTHVIYRPGVRFCYFYFKRYVQGMARFYDARRDYPFHVIRQTSFLILLEGLTEVDR